MSRLSRPQLAAAGIRRWQEWFRDGLLAFTRTERVEERVRAFLPLVINPLGHHPAGQLAREIRNLLEDRVSRPGAALSKVLTSWSVPIDGSAGAALGIGVATQLDAPNLAALCERIMRQYAGLGDAAADAIAWACIRAVALRGSNRQLMKLGGELNRSKLWTPSLAAEFGAVLAKDNLQALPARILAVAPVLKAEPQTGQYLSELANRLRLEFSRDELRKALSVNLADPEDVSRLRRDLFEQLLLEEDYSLVPVTPEAVDRLADLAGRTIPKERLAKGVEERFAIYDSPGGGPNHPGSDTVH